MKTEASRSLRPTPWLAVIDLKLRLRNRSVNVYVRIVFLFLIGGVFGGCVFPPTGWSSKEAIQRLVNEKVPVGSSKKVAEGFFREAGVKWDDVPIASHPAHNTLIAWVVTNQSFWVRTSVGVSIYIGADGRVERVEVKESHMGL